MDTPIEIENSPKPIYNLSRDYETLYDLIKQGHTIPCFVDHRFGDEDKHVIRDVASVKWLPQFKYINIGVRGMQYDGVDPHEIEHFKKSEKELFISACGRINLEYMPPHNLKLGIVKTLQNIINLEPYDEDVDIDNLAIALATAYVSRIYATFGRLPNFIAPTTENGILLEYNLRKEQQGCRVDIKVENGELKMAAFFGEHLDHSGAPTDAYFIMDI